MIANSNNDFRNINDDRQYGPQAKLSPLKGNEQKLSRNITPHCPARILVPQSRDTQSLARDTP